MSNPDDAGGDTSGQQDAGGAGNVRQNATESGGPGDEEVAVECILTNAENMDVRMGTLRGRKEKGEEKCRILYINAI